MLPDLVKAYKQSQGVNRLEITSMRTIADILNKVPMAKDVFRGGYSSSFIFHSTNHYVLLKGVFLVSDVLKPTFSP